jgi:hypothetical protein
LLKIILYGLLIWFLYNLIFRLIIPVYRASRQMKRQFRAMQEKMQQQARQQEQASAAFTEQKLRSESPRPKSEDYIDFEEIR